MKEEYVNEKITRKLIDKGCPVRLVIKADALIPILYELPKEHPDWQYCKAWYIPTISQVLKWLREEKNLYVCPTLNAYCGKRKKDKAYILWMFRVKNIAYNYLIYPNPLDMHDTYETYEEAALAGIEYVLDNLI